MGNLGLNSQNFHLYGLLLGLYVIFEFDHSSPGTQGRVILQYFCRLKRRSLVLMRVLPGATLILVKSFEQRFRDIALALL